MTQNFPKPSKKIISLIIVAIAIISGVLIIKFNQGKGSAQTSLSYDVTDIGTYNSTHTQDAGQNLNDLLGINNQNQTDNATDTANTSDLVARSLFSGALSLSQSGDESDQSKQNLASSIAGQAAQSFAYDTYTPDKLKIISAPNKENIKFFASSLATIQNNILIGMAKESTDPNNVRLKNVAQVYKNAAQNVYDLGAPVDVANTVLGIVNNYSVVSSVYNALANADKNPVEAAIAVKYLQEANLSQTNYVNAIANYLKDNGIIFTSDEVGSYWNNFGTTGTITNTSTQSQ